MNSLTEQATHPLEGRRILLLAAAGLFFRLLLIALEPPSRLAGDEITWVGWALHEVDGLLSPDVRFSPIRSDMIFYPPLYPYFIAVVFAFFGSLAAVQIAQAILSSLLIPIVGVIGNRLFGPRAGTIAAAFTAFFPELCWYCAHYWSETLFLTLLFWGFERLLAADALPPASPARSRAVRILAASLWLIPPLSSWLALRHQNVWIAGCLFLAASTLGWLLLRRLLAMRDPAQGALLAAGVLWGLAILTRETLLYFLPIAALWLGWKRPRGAARAALLLATALAVIAPWTYRNAILFRALVPVSTSGALNLWQGNTHLTRQEVYRETEGVHGESLRRNRIAQWRFHRRMAREVILARQPWWLFEKLRDEMPSFWEADSVALIHLKEKKAYGPYSLRMLWSVALFILLPYVFALAFFTLGLAAAPSARPLVLLIAFLLYYNLLHVVSHGFSRYRLPIMPIVFILAASAMAAVIDRRPLLWSPRRRVAALIIGLTLAASVVPSLIRHARDHAFRSSSALSFPGRHPSDPDAGPRSGRD